MGTLEILKLELPKALWGTFVMVSISTVVAVILGGLLGLVLFLISHPLFTKRKGLYNLISFIVNAVRSLPFLILMVVAIPLAKLIIGDPYTPLGGVVSLSIAAVPFFARIAAGAFQEVDTGKLEAAVATGAKPWLIISEVVLPESFPSLIRGIVLTIISLLGFSAMLGTIGAGGIGDLAIQYGYFRYETGVLVAIIIILVIIVQCIQWIGDFFADYLTKN